MEKHEMMSLEDSGQLRDKIRFFEQELLKNHHIDPNLYVEYNVKRGLRDSAGKGVLTGLQRFLMLMVIILSTADRFRLMDVYTIRESMYRISSVV